MNHTIDLAEQIGGTYWHAAAILKLDVDSIIKAPLEELRFQIGSGAVTRRVQAEVGALSSGPSSLSVPLHWTAAEHPNLFPIMEGQLHIRDVAGNHIGLRLVGEYRTPLGALGTVGDLLAGRRVAERSLQDFLTEVARQLEAKLVEHAGPAGVEP
jgi:hypothetical protein